MNAESMADRRSRSFFDGVTLPGSSEPDPYYMPPPSALLALTEPHRATLEVLSLASLRGLLKDMPAGPGNPVMVLPAFSAPTATTRRCGASSASLATRCTAGAWAGIWARAETCWTS